MKGSRSFHLYEYLSSVKCVERTCKWMLPLCTKLFTGSPLPFAWRLRNLAWHLTCLPSPSLISVSWSIPHYSLFLSYTVLTYNTASSIILSPVTSYTSTSLGLHSLNLSSKNVLSFFIFLKLVGICLVFQAELQTLPSRQTSLRPVGIPPSLLLLHFVHSFLTMVTLFLAPSWKARILPNLSPQGLANNWYSMHISWIELFKLLRASLIRWLYHPGRKMRRGGGYRFHRVMFYWSLQIFRHFRCHQAETVASWGPCSVPLFLLISVSVTGLPSPPLHGQ